MNYREVVRNSVTSPVNFLVLITTLLMIPKFTTPGKSDGRYTLTCCPPSSRRFTGTRSYEIPFRASARESRVYSFRHAQRPVSLIMGSGKSHHLHVKKEWCLNQKRPYPSGKVASVH